MNDIISKSLGIMSLSKESLILIQETINDYEHLKGVPCFEGWKIGEFTKEHRKNMSIAASKRIRTKEHLEKLHAGRKASKNSLEHAAAIIASRVGSKHSEETKKKMREAKAKISQERKSEIGRLARSSHKDKKEGLVNGD